MVQTSPVAWRQGTSEDEFKFKLQLVQVAQVDPQAAGGRTWPPRGPASGRVSAMLGELRHLIPFAGRIWCCAARARSGAESAPGPTLAAARPVHRASRQRDKNV